MATEKDDKPKRDFRQDLTNQIVDLIEQGAAPWQKPWNPDAASSFLEMPHNATSGRAYRGGNALYLMAKAQLMGSDDPRWCTFKQAQAEGWQVKKGSKGTSVEYWQFDKEEERFDPTTGKKEKVTVKLENPRVFYATVFHASQIEGIPEYKRRERPDGWNPVEEADRILTGSGARIFHDQQDRAYYSPGADEIHLPPREAFPQPLDYYEVAMHELGHWTGHEKRLNRDLSGGFGSESYAREELRAQMASLYLSAELGVPFNPERHAAYQASWVKALKEDKHEIFRAARDAEIMADYVIDLARERTIEQAQERTAEPAVARALEVDIAEAMTDPSVTFDHFTAYQGASLDDALRSRNLATVGAVTGHDPEKFYETAHDRLSAVFGIDPEHDEMGNAYLERKGLAQHFALTAERLTKALELTREQQPEQAVTLPTPDQEPKAMETAQQEVAATGITRIDDKEANSIRFTRSQLEGGELAYTAAFYSGSKIVAKFEQLDADALADTVGDKNAKAIMQAEADKGILKGDALHNEYGISPEENQRRSAAKEQRKAVEYDAMRQEQEGRILAELQTDPKAYRDNLSRAGIDELEYHRDHLTGMVPLNTQNPFWQRHELPFEIDGLEQNIDKALDKIDALIDMHHTRTPVAELTTMPGVALTVNDRKELIATLPNNQEIMFGGTPAFIQWAEENKLTRAERDAGYQALGAIARDNRDTDRSLAAYMAKTPEMLGEGGKLYSPRPDAARQYDGKFIYMNENYAVQQIGKDTAIVHDLEKIGRGEALERIANSIETGKALRMAYEPGRDAPAIADAPSLEQNRDRLSRGYQEVKQAVAAELGAEAKTYIPNRNAQEYRGSVIFVNETHVVQQVGKATAIAHLRENFDEVPEIGGQMRVSYKDGRMTQRTTPGQEAELQSLKTEHMGKDAKLQFAYDNEGRQTFDGPIVAETGSYVIQKVNDQTAIVHAKTNLQKDVEVGHNLSIVYEHGKVYAEELSADKQREHAKHDAQEKGHTAESAREQVREKFGKDAKIVDAKFVDAEQGNFTGTVVAQDDDRVIQRIGANKFIAHERSALDGGDVGIGQFVKVQYNQGKAIVQGAQRQQQQDRQRGPDREIAR